MCKAAHEPGGPLRCSGDARRNLERSQSAAERIQEWEETLQRYMSGERVAWGPYIGPPPFAPPFGPSFEQWYAEAQHMNPDMDRETGYGIFYNLAGTPQDWAALGYSATQPPCPNGSETEAHLSDGEAATRMQQWEETLQRYMSGERVAWGPHVGPPPFAPPFAAPFEQWYREALRDGHISAEMSYEDAYADYYNLSGTPQEWAARGYTAAPPAAAAPEHTTTGPNAGLHAALRGAASRFLDAEELSELDNEVAAALSERPPRS